MSTYMLILVCLSVITHHATSRMINTIADIDMNEDIESRGEMIRTMRGDIEIMLGLQSVIKTMLEEAETKGKKRDEQVLKGLNRLLQNTSHVQTPTEEEQGNRGVSTNITQTTESMQVSLHNQPENVPHGNLSDLVVITTTPLPNPNTTSTITTTTTNNPDMIRNRQIYVRRFGLYLVKRTTQCENGLMPIHEARDLFASSNFGIRGVSYYKGYQFRNRRCVFTNYGYGYTCRAFSSSIWNDDGAFFVCNQVLS